MCFPPKKTPREENRLNWGGEKAKRTERAGHVSDDYWRENRKHILSCKHKAPLWLFNNRSCTCHILKPDNNTLKTITRSLCSYKGTVLSLGQQLKLKSLHLSFTPKRFILVLNMNISNLKVVIEHDVYITFWKGTAAKDSFVPLFLKM